MDGAPPVETPPPFLMRAAEGAPLPIILSVPHAGRYYPPEIDAARAVGWRQLYDLEDRYADRLIGPALAAGARAIVATHARAWIDLNRGADDRPGAPASPHGRAGLGIIPLRLATRTLWRETPNAADVSGRIASLHTSYHVAIDAALREVVARQGQAVLIDCHSMPPIASGPGHGAKIVIGDRHGATAGREIVAAIEASAGSTGIHVSRNAPYAGAYTLERHGAPMRGIHAVQIEFDRSLYLDPTLREPGAGLAATAGLLATIVRAAAAALDSPQALAAE